MLKKLSVTYHAPKGDSKVVEMMGHTFYDGKAEEIEIDEDNLKTLQGNRFFECGKPTDAPPHVEKPEPDPEPKHEAHNEPKHGEKEHKGR